MHAGKARGCEICISGWLKGQRAKTAKYKSGVKISTGQPAIDYVLYAVRHVLVRKGVVGVRVKIMLPIDETG